MNKLLTAAFSAALAAVCAAGCQNSVNTIENQQKNMVPNTISDARFVTDGFLRDRLKLTQVNASDTPAGLLQVQVTAQNVRTGFFDQAWTGLTGENPYKIDYKFTWLNRNGMVEKSANSIWRTVAVQPGETVFFNAVAPTPACRDFVLNLRESK